VKTDTTCVEAAKDVFQTVLLVEENLLKSGIFPWRSLQLPPYIRARTGNLAVEGPSQ